jgi:Ran-binding protein 3
MRTSGTLRVIFNTWLFPGMSIEKPSENTVRLTGMEDGQLKVFLIKGSAKDAKELFSALNSRLKSKDDSISEEPKVKKSSFDVSA